MSKTSLTRQLEIDLLLKLHGDGERAINECTLGKHGIVDVISYSSKNVYTLKPGNKRRTRTRHPIWRCYEIKTSKSDFFSPSKWTFIGHYNYFVIPHSLYSEIKDSIPNGVGVIGYDEYTREFNSIKRATKSVPKMTNEDITSEVMSSMSRELERSVYGERGIKSISNKEIYRELINRTLKADKEDKTDYYLEKIKLLV